MRSRMQATLVEVLSSILRPLVSLYLRCGVGFSEFQGVVRTVYVSVAAEEYGIRGRPTNTSRISAMTGVSRKEVKRIRDQIRDRWTPAMELSPVNLLIHYWHYDQEFCDRSGVPRPLPVDGKSSFAALAQRYVGDIPIGALRDELKRTGVVAETDGILTVSRRYFQAESFDEDFVRNMAFSLTSLSTTIVHNSKLISRADFSQEVNEKEGRFERFAWSDQMAEGSREQFRKWVRSEGQSFIEKADAWIGCNEVERASWDEDCPRNIGVGVYFFEED